MKVALISAGACRPNKERCVRNIEKIRASLEGTDFENVFIGYNTPVNQYLAERMNFDSVVLMKDRSDAEINAQFPKVAVKNAQKGWASQSNIFRYRQQIKTALDLIKETMPDCTHICLHRVCHRTEFDVSVFKEDAYNVPDENGRAVNDCFGFSSKEIFKKIWDYGDKTFLENMKDYDSDEEMVRFCANAHGVNVVAAPLRVCRRRVDADVANMEDLYGDLDG